VVVNNSNDAVKFNLAGCGLQAIVMVDAENRQQYDLQGMKSANADIGPLDYRILLAE
jgi:hypothetical protein